MRHRMLVVAEARPRQFARHHPATHPGIAFEHQHPLTALGEVGRGHQPVVAAADGDDVIVSRLGLLIAGWIV